MGDQDEQLFQVNTRLQARGAHRHDFCVIALQVDAEGEEQAPTVQKGWGEDTVDKKAVGKYVCLVLTG